MLTDFFPPRLGIPAGHQPLQLAELKAECPAAVHYMAPWGEKQAQEEEKKRA